MIRLFIENKEVELDSSVQFAITKQFEDITNPTTIINDWSKTVEIPFTQSNNALFGHIFNPDKVIVDGGLTGIYFNPLKKLTFRLEWGDNVIMQGYCKLNEIKQNNGMGTYNITLFGELGKVFSEMKKITFDESEDSDYLIDGSEYVDEYITKELIYDSWVSTGQTSDNLTGNFTNYIGFAPNNSLDSDFDYKTWQNGELESTTFEITLTENNFKEETGIEASTAIPNGLYPREIGEYRSYLQLPYIYFNKLFKIFQAKAEYVTGYNFDLSSSWFSTTNPFWYDLVYMLKKLDVANGNSYNNYYSDICINNSDTKYMLAQWTSYNENYTRERSGKLLAKNIISEQIPILSNNRINITDAITLNYHLNTYFYLISTGIAIKTDNGLLLTIQVTGENGETESKEYLIINKNSTLTYNNATIIKTDTASDYILEVPPIDIYFTLSEDKFGGYVTTTYKLRWLSSSYPYTGAAQGGSDFDLNFTTNPCLLNAKISGKYWARSNGKLTLNKLWNNDYNLFEEILNYCKMYRIGIFVDEFTKTISFKPLAEYFADYSITDWTDKVDKSKDYIIKPVTFENKYIKFNYEDDDTKLSKQYAEKYGVNYGEYRLISEYNFNEDTENLFDGVKLSINNTDNVLSWTNLYNNKNIIYSFPAEIYVYNKDSEGKNVDCFGRYYFFKGLKSFDTELQLRNVIISDDTAIQQYNDTYFYSQSYNSVGVATYPYLSVVKDNKLCLFAKPLQNYIYLFDEYDSSEGIYNQVWQNYINERYSANNKIVTCYVTLKPSDYIQFKFNQFVKIGNQLYMVNKIYDYDISSNESTKVDLITIQDINGYTTNNFTSNN